jgi:hypothetical protein
VVCSLSKEKANLQNMHPDVIAQMDKTNEGNKCNLAESNADLVEMMQKRQHNVGHYKAMTYFIQDDIKRLTWSAPLFNDGNVNLYGSKNAKYLCHLEKELANMKLMYCGFLSATHFFSDLSKLVAKRIIIAAIYVLRNDTFYIFGRWCSVHLFSAQAGWITWLVPFGGKIPLLFFLAGGTGKNMPGHDFSPWNIFFVSVAD